jgi:ComF family protein
MFGRVHVKCHRSWGPDGIIIGFEYQSIIKKLITKIKYKYVRDMVPEVLELLISLVDFSPIDKNTWEVIPVPLHKSKLRERGFNQSELIATQIAAYLDTNCQTQWLIKIKATKPQMSLSAQDRKLNLKGVFKLTDLGKVEVFGKNILLIDDVWTTGTTIRECTKVLKKAGAKTVWGLAIAG